MTQYCRYCANLVTGNGIYCTYRNKTIEESTAKKTNKCKDFEFHSVDAFCENEKGYNPRKKKENADTNQLEFAFRGFNTT